MNHRVVIKKRKADHGGAEEDASEQPDPDLISNLPDCVLGTIVSLLGAEDGARTAALARRWRHVWRDAAPLNLDDPLPNVADDDLRVQRISQILSAHPGPTRRVAFRSLRLGLNVLHYDAWFRLPLLDAIQELVLCFRVDVGYPRLPVSALRFAAALRVLDVRHCRFPAASSGVSPAFPCLTDLSLCEVVVDAELLEGIFSNSPGIDTMKLLNSFGHRRLRVSNLPRLRRLAVAVKRCFNLSLRKEEEIELNDLVVEDAVSLEQLVLDQIDQGPSVDITGATKLKVLGYLQTGFPVFDHGNLVFNKGTLPVSPGKQLSTVRTLALDVAKLNLKQVVDFLSYFPSIEKLHIKIESQWMSMESTGVFYAPVTPIECLDRSLKIIELQPYNGYVSHAEFAKFFIQRAKVLELMKFGGCGGHSPRWVQQQRTQFSECKASRCAQFSFGHEIESPNWMEDCFTGDDPFSKK
ncbi:hypothetical protein EJB05_03569 [Eragrostis curvula]|uniref:Uncharacterized protein n=1 Tax=Eragrostis curvula TaxID=38414 RepID=A0A5J9W833_9POAL|nr:hypothetical protein EJB05_03569 [Eragrostis curvula]